MIIGGRLREMREEKKLSQGDIEKRTGLLRCYISRVENGHTVPAIETLEKMARALECPLYQLFYEGEEPPKLPNLLKRKSSDDIAWGSVGKDARYLNKLRRPLGKTEEGDRKLILHMAQKMANRYVRGLSFWHLPLSRTTTPEMGRTSIRRGLVFRQAAIDIRRYSSRRHFRVVARA
jgi:transcriptional regulator with XRE-family HTH domain